MEATEFIPPGANILVNKPLSSKVRGTPKARYPSTAECISPDGNAVVGLSSDKAAAQMHHRLLLFKRGDEASRTVLVTPNYFDVVWSVTGEHVAVTEYVGRNTSDVLLTERTKGVATRIDVRPVLEQLFRPEVLLAPRFQKAFGWLDGSHLVLRAMGRIQAPPYEVFGYELVIDAAHLDDPEKVTVVAAFTKIYQR